MSTTKNKIEVVKAILVLQLLTLSLIACVKERPDIEAFNDQQEKLIQVDQLGQWKHSVTTGSEVDFASVTVSENLRVNSFKKTVTYCPANIGIKEKKSGDCPVKKITDDLIINMQGVVKFNTDSPLLKGNENQIKFIGLPKKTYPLVYKKTPHFLKIYKKVKTTDISHYELPYAEKEGSSYLVPIGGFKAQYYNIEFIKNPNDNVNTNVRKKYSLPPKRYKEAKYIWIDRENFTPFKALIKTDVFPASYFLEGDWYFAKSQISAKPGNEGAIGFFHGGLSTEFKMANKISFKISKNLLRGFNVAIAEKKVKATKDSDQVDDVINIPVYWFDSRAKPKGRSETGLSEELWDIKNDHERKYGSFLFSHIGDLTGGTGFRGRIFRGVVRGKKLEDIQIRKDSFSITLLTLASGEKWRYTFLKAKPRQYDEKKYFIYDKDIFGAFATHKPYVYSSEDERRSDLEKNIVINRYNPKSNEIVFRFSQDTPKWEDTKKNKKLLQIDYREAGRRCVRYWNRAFQLAGTKLNVRLDESRDVELGDLDSNIINLIATVNETGLLGVGPSLADPESGEILSGAANIYVSSQKASIIGHLRNYVRVRSGYVQDTAFSPEIQKEFPLMGHFKKQVEHHCPGLQSHAVSLDGQPQIDSDNENIEINKCLEKLLPQELVKVTCHEMGHVFALRHNFKGSADKENSFKDLDHMKKLYPPEQFPEIYEEYYAKAEFFPQGSSIMDYQSHFAPNLVVPGLYDIAALAFVYSDKLELKNTRNQSQSGFGQLISYDKNSPLRDQEVYKLEASSYEYCTDDHVKNAKKISPFCEKGDYGATPLALMDFYFSRLKNYIVINGRRWDRARHPNPSLGMGLGPVGSSIERISDMQKLWRAYLYDYTGRDQSYLQDYQNHENYTDLMSKIKNNFARPEFIGVSQKYAKFMMSLVKIPDYFCVAVRSGSNKKSLIPENDIQLFRFSNLYREITTTTVNKIVEGCKDPIVTQYLKNSMGWEIVDEVGYPLSDLRFSSLDDDRFEANDVIGIAQLRRTVFSEFTGTLGTTNVVELQKRNFTPAAFDEYNMRQNFLNFAKNRLFKGLDVKKTVVNKLKVKGYILEEGAQLKAFKVFGREMDFIIDSIEKIRLQPGAKALSAFDRDEWVRPYNIYSSRDYDKKKQGEEHYHFDTSSKSYFMFASENESFTYQVINETRKLTEPLRSNLDLVEPQSQQALNQIAEIAKKLPATQHHNIGFSALQLKSFVEHMDQVLARPDISGTLKTPEVIAWFNKFRAAVKNLKILEFIARGGVVEPGSIFASLTAEQAKDQLQLIESKSSALANYLQKYFSLTPEDVTQIGFAKIWLSQQSEALRIHWKEKTIPRVNDWVLFFNDSPEEYNGQLKALEQLMALKLIESKRDSH